MYLFIQNVVFYHVLLFTFEICFILNAIQMLFCKERDTKKMTKRSVEACFCNKTVCKNWCLYDNAHHRKHKLAI